VERINKFLGGALPRSSPQDASNQDQVKQGQTPGYSQTRGNSYKSSYSPDSRGSFYRRRSAAPTDLTLIKSILAKALAGKGIDKKIERYEFVLHWDKIVGEKLAEVSKPDYISRKTLIVRVLHPVWAQEFTFMKGTLLRKLAPYLKRGDVVDDMIFRVGPLEE
jgi:predicted nucleic acid-binding Zn ribbon protein